MGLTGTILPKNQLLPVKTNEEDPSLGVDLNISELGSLEPEKKKQVAQKRTTIVILPTGVIENQSSSSSQSGISEEELFLNMDDATPKEERTKMTGKQHTQSFIVIEDANGDPTEMKDFDKNSLFQESFDGDNDHSFPNQRQLEIQSRKDKDRFFNSLGGWNADDKIGKKQQAEERKKRKKEEKEAR